MADKKDPLKDLEANEITAKGEEGRSILVEEYKDDKRAARIAMAKKGDRRVGFTKLDEEINPIKPKWKFWKHEGGRLATVAVLCLSTNFALRGGGAENQPKKSPEQTRITALETQITELEAKNTGLTTKNAELKELQATLAKQNLTLRIHAQSGADSSEGADQSNPDINIKIVPDISRGKDVVFLPTGSLIAKSRIAFDHDIALKIIGSLAADNKTDSIHIDSQSRWDMNSITQIDEEFLQSPANLAALNQLKVIITNDISERTAQGLSTDGFYYITSDETGNVKIYRDVGQQGGNDVSLLYQTIEQP